VRLLLRFAAARRRIEPVELEISDLDASLISAFLDHREQECGNSIRTRNARLIAIRSLFRSPRAVPGDRCVEQPARGRRAVGIATARARSLTRMVAVFSAEIDARHGNVRTNCATRRLRITGHQPVAGTGEANSRCAFKPV
jgi:hypothetical protein